MFRKVAYHVKGIVQAGKFSLNGLSYAVKNERAFKAELFFSLFIVPLAFYLGENFLERSILLLTWLLIPIMEIMNSAVEAVVDRVGTEHNELSGRAKDLGSATVFLCILLFLVIWGMKLFDQLLL